MQSRGIVIALVFALCVSGGCGITQNVTDARTQEAITSLASPPSPQSDTIVWEIDGFNPIFPAGYYKLSLCRQGAERPYLSGIMIDREDAELLRQWVSATPLPASQEMGECFPQFVVVGRELEAPSFVNTPSLAADWFFVTIRNGGVYERPTVERVQERIVDDFAHLRCPDLRNVDEEIRTQASDSFFKGARKTRTPEEAYKDIGYRDLLRRVTEVASLEITVVREALYGDQAHPLYVVLRQRDGMEKAIEVFEGGLFAEREIRGGNIIAGPEGLR